MTSPSIDSEYQPLLPQRPFLPSKGQESSARRWLQSKWVIWKGYSWHKDGLTVLCIFLLQLFVSFAKHIIEVPTVRLLEIAICNKYYRTHSVPNTPLPATREVQEELCKIPPVQNNLAFLTGWKFAFDALPGILTAIQYGVLADYFGRKPVLVLFTSGMLTSLMWTIAVCYADEILPARLVWASSIFILIGGGRRVFKGIIFTVIADTVDLSRRTRCMYLLSAIPHVVTIVAPPFSNLFMRINIWLPFEIACGILISTYLIIWLMPEPLRRSSPNQISSSEAQVFSGVTQNTQNAEEHEPLLQNRNELTQESCNSRDSWMSIPRDITALFRVPNFLFIFIAFFLKPIALISKAFIFQHASESFGWKIIQTTWLRVSQAAGSAFITIIFLPILSTILTRKGFDRQKTDFGAIRWSIAIAIIGFGMLWLAKASGLLVFGLFVCGLSEGLEPALQGLATASVPEAFTARMFTTLAVIETIGKLVGGPLMAKLFSIGRSRDRGSSGINFLTSSIIFMGLEIYSWTLGMKS